MQKHKSQLTTLCYLKRDNQYLMLHRTVKKNDVNKDKWIGVGGHFEADESPEDCVIREVREETGYTLEQYTLHGVVTFISAKQEEAEYMFVYTASAWSGEPIPCNEGELEWVDIDKVPELNTWEGDRIFLRLLRENAPFFTLKLVYDKDDVMTEAVLNGTVCAQYPQRNS